MSIAAPLLALLPSAMAVSRVSIDEDDPGFTMNRYRAYLNGNELRDCVMADTALGVAVVNVRNEKGRLIIIDDGNGGSIARKELRGAITLKRIPGRRDDAY